MREDKSEMENEIIEYADLTEGEQRIVDAGNVDPKDCIKVPGGLTRDELIVWMTEQFGTGVTSTHAMKSVRDRKLSPRSR